MFSADGLTVLYQNPASQAYLGPVWTGLEAHLGLDKHSAMGGGFGAGGGSPRRPRLRQQQEGRRMPGVRRRAPLCAAAAHDASPNWLQRLFSLDMGSLERMMATTSCGKVWRWVAGMCRAWAFVEMGVSGVGDGCGVGVSGGVGWGGVRFDEWGVGGVGMYVCWGEIGRAHV